MKHLMLNVTNNQNLSFCVNAQNKGVQEIFDHSLATYEGDLNEIDIDEFINAGIDLLNAGEEILYCFIEEDKISDTGFYEDGNKELWLDIATMDNLRHEITQEINYQTAKRNG